MNDLPKFIMSQIQTHGWRAPLRSDPPQPLCLHCKRGKGFETAGRAFSKGDRLFMGLFISQGSITAGYSQFPRSERPACDCCPAGKEAGWRPTAGSLVPGHPGRAGQPWFVLQALFLQGPDVEALQATLWGVSRGPSLH